MPAKSGSGRAAWIVAVVLIAIGRWIFSGGAARQNQSDTIREVEPWKKLRLEALQFDAATEKWEAIKKAEDAIALDRGKLLPEAVHEFEPLFGSLRRKFRSESTDRYRSSSSSTWIAWRSS